MSNLLRLFDRFSFWFGFLTGTLMWLLLGRLRPLFARIRQKLREQAQSTRREKTLSDEIRIGNDMLRLAQGRHLAAPLFSLDEILITPRVLAPPSPPLAYNPPLSEDITNWVIPFMPDWPELASYYYAPTLCLAEALQGGENLAVTGLPGVGKTVALAHLATQIIRKDPEASELAGFVPLLLHAAELVLPPQNPEILAEPLFNAVSIHIFSVPQSRLFRVLHSLLEEGRLLLLLDGLDEFSPQLLGEVTQYLHDMLKKYPGLRVVVATAPDNLGNLLSLRFIPLPITSWNQSQREAFIRQWSNQWNHYLVDLTKSRIKEVDPLLLVGWMLNNTSQITPLELTMKVWAAFAGDALGPRPVDTIEAYLQRLSYGQPDRNRVALEQLASQMILTMLPVAPRSSAEKWLSGIEVGPGDVETEPDLQEETIHKERIRIRGSLPELIECGLVQAHLSDRLTISHPEIAAYLAGQVLIPVGGGRKLAQQPSWTGKGATLRYLAIQAQQAPWIDEMQKEEDIDILMRGLLEVSRWLRGAPQDLPWITSVMRQLSENLHKEYLPFGLRMRILSALVISGNPGVPVLLRQLLASPQPQLRQLAALGCGVFRDKTAVEAITELLYDPSPSVSRAAVLALVAIGDKTAMEAVAYLLLHGDEGFRRAAAEGLANHPEEGHSTLEEACTFDDPAVRRAAAFGLGRIKQPWATDIIEKMHTGDTQWVVQDAASQTLSSIKSLNPRIPRRLPPLAQTTWLVSFAGERGMGVAPGKPAYDLLYQALKEGDEDQRLAALYFLLYQGSQDAILPLYQTYFSSSGDIREAAFDALWNLSATGVELPPPIQYGLG